MIEGELYSALDELRQRSEHAKNVYVPTDIDGHNQKSFHISEARYRLLTGGNQSGKSHAAAYEIACWATGTHPYRPVPQGDIEIWVISAEYVTLRTGIYRHLLNLLPKWDIIDRGANVPGHRLSSFLSVRRKDGSTANIWFMSSKGESREKFQAAAVNLIAIDEEIPEIIWEELEARTLATGGQFIISATLVESYDWILKLEQMGEKAATDPQADQNVFLTRLRTDLNPYIDQETLRFLMEKWSAETQEFRIFGKSRRSVGLVYNTWNPDIHVVKPFKIPFDWPRWCIIDPGIRICAVLWITVGPDRKAYAYRELYCHNESLYEVARAIKTAEGWILNKELSKEFGHYVWEEPTDLRIGVEHMVNRIIDPSSIRRTEAGEDSILTLLHERYGIACSLADNSKRSGIEACRFWLENGFRCFSILENFLDERRSYRLRSGITKKDRNEPIDEPVKAKDHLMDCWRYSALERPTWEDRLSLPYWQERTKEMSTRSIADFIARKKESARQHEFLGTEF